jgi:ketosteroid isomerase-like protein
MSKVSLQFIVLFCCTLFFADSGFTQVTRPGSSNEASLRPIIDSIDRQFSRDFYNGDSIALAAYYTHDAQFGCAKGAEILASWNKSIQRAIKNNTRTLIFSTTSLTVTGEFLLEVGSFQNKDESGTTKSSGQYLVVWKQENGTWKIHRDIGL